MATSNILRAPIRTPELENLPTGDVRRGQSLVVWAIAEGRAAAAVLHETLNTL